ncbi:MAG TPA: NAD(P)/FAD-dependent oxidoreductase [Verrucomicrobiae bacterium]|nr:NAD(P)/FAD-dependent oxidoreductase [Verrucomicrobiae bacterium]
MPNVVVVGGGAAGFFAAITAAEAGARVTLLERGPQFLSKVRISGGGRCNVTHACFEPREFTRRYPRGDRELIGPFHRFQARDTVAWFEARGVPLKAEPDGRMFPTTDSSQTIIDCLMHAAQTAGVKLRLNSGVDQVRREPAGGFSVVLGSGEILSCERVLLAIGGCRSAALGQLAVSLGHTLVPPVPSLFTFQIEAPWLRALAGVSVAEAEVAAPDLGLCERGPLLVTHWGLSGPVVLRLSAWGARQMCAVNYHFTLRVNWLPQLREPDLVRELQSRRAEQGARLVTNAPLAPLTARLWGALVEQAGLGPTARWASLTRTQHQQLVRQLTSTAFSVTGKSLNKDEFVTCGGVRLNEVNFKTMESRICPGLHFAGELLDIDGITGGFNFQAAWTTGWLAGTAMAAG